MVGIIYKYESPSGKVYIGQTINLKDRRRCFNNINKRYSGTKFMKAIKKYGRENFKFSIISQIICDDKTELRNQLDELEKFYIKKYDSYNNGYNMTEGGSGSKGCFQTEESRKLISEKAKGRKNAFLGRHHSEETRKLLSEKAKLRVKELNPFFGKHHSEESKKKISKANGMPVVQIDKNTGEIIAEYGSANLASIALGSVRGRSEILKVCNNYVSPSGKRYLTALGYKWKFKESSTTSKS